MTAQGNRPSTASPSRQRIPDAGGRLNRPFGVRPYLQPRPTPPVISFESEPPSTPGVETASATRSAAFIGAAFILSRLLGILRDVPAGPEVMFLDDALEDAAFTPDAPAP